MDHNQTHYWHISEIEPEQLFENDGEIFRVIGIADEPTVTVESLRTGKREHHVISSLNFSRFRKVESPKCVNNADGKCVLPARERVKADILGAWGIIQSRGDLSETIKHLLAGYRLLTGTNEDNGRIYELFIEVLTCSKENGGYGYCRDCAEKELELFCTKDISTAYPDDPQDIKKHILIYVHMVIGMDADLGPEKIWRYIDPQTKEHGEIKIDARYIENIEYKLGLRTQESKETFRTAIRKIYCKRMKYGGNYDFMDNYELVRAVIEFRRERKSI